MRIKTKIEVPESALLLTLPQVAMVLQAALWRVRCLIWGGQLPYIKLGRRFLVPRKAVEEFVRVSTGMEAEKVIANSIVAAEPRN